MVDLSVPIPGGSDQSDPAIAFQIRLQHKKTTQDLVFSIQVRARANHRQEDFSLFSRMKYHLVSRPYALLPRNRAGTRS
jgi:hypothetical protein